MPEFVVPEDLSPDDPLAVQILKGENQLLAPETRHNRQLLHQLLHEDFEEVGASGRSYDRAQIITQLSDEANERSSHIQLDDPRLIQLSDSLVLLRWRSGPDNLSQRASLWVYGAHGWQMLFHQGTREPVLPPLRGSASVPGLEQSAVVRPLLRSDAPQVLQAFASHADMARQGEVRTLAEAQNYVDWLLKNPAKNIALAIVQDSLLVGLVCANVDTGNRNAWVWYWMHAAHRGAGLTSRALATLSEQLFTTHQLHRLELGLRVNNPASKKVAERCGFVLEGCEREKFLIDGQRIDVLNYARLRSDPAAQVTALRFLGDNQQQ